MIAFREATRADIPAILALLRDDRLGTDRETRDLSDYEAAFDAMERETFNMIILGETEGRVVATCQLTFISGLSLRATRRAQVESVRVASDLRGQGVGHAMMAEVERRATDAGCRMLQLTMHTSRDRTRTFYESLGYTPSHIGFKATLPR